MNHGFSISSAISQSWKLMKTHYRFLIPAVILSGVITGIMQLLSTKTEHMVIASLIVTVISIIVSLALTVGWTNVILKLIRGTSQEWQDFKIHPKIWGKVLLGQMIIIIPIVIIAIAIFMLVFFSQNLILFYLGIIIVIIALIYTLVKFMFLTTVAIDYQELGIINLLKKAGKMTKGQFLDLLGFVIIITLINIGGIFFLFVGLLITIPLTTIAKIVVYEKINSKTVSE